MSVSKIGGIINYILANYRRDALASPSCRSLKRPKSFDTTTLILSHVGKNGNDTELARGRRKREKTFGFRFPKDDDDSWKKKKKKKLWAFVFLRLYSRESRVYIRNGRIYRGERSLEHMRCYPSIPPSIVVSCFSVRFLFSGLPSPPSGRAHICKINCSWEQQQPSLLFLLFFFDYFFFLLVCWCHTISFTRYQTSVKPHFPLHVLYL